MKKLIAAWCLIFVLLFSVNAFACDEGAVLPNVTTAECTMSGEAWWVLSESHHLCGKLTMTEQLPVLPVQNVTGNYIRGGVDNGVIREKAEAAYLNIDGTICGLTPVCTSVDILPGFQGMIEDLIHIKISQDEVLSVRTIIACTIRRTEKTVCHYFFRSDMNKVFVGTVTVNKGKQTFALYLGDWDGDGENELGFAAGYILQPVNHTSTNCTKTEKHCGKKLNCSKEINIQVRFEWNFELNFSQKAWCVK